MTIHATLRDKLRPLPKPSTIGVPVAWLRELVAQFRDHGAACSANEIAKLITKFYDEAGQ